MAAPEGVAGKVFPIARLCGIVALHFTLRVEKKQGPKLRKRAPSRLHIGKRGVEFSGIGFTTRVKERVRFEGRCVL
jgi:hypothetical protein